MPTIRVSDSNKATFQHAKTLLEALDETTYSEGEVFEEIVNVWLKTSLEVMLAPNYEYVDVQKVALRINAEVQAVSI